MEQKIFLKEEADGFDVEEGNILIVLRDSRYRETATEVHMTLTDAMELYRLLDNKLGEIPA